MYAHSTQFYFQENMKILKIFMAHGTSLDDTFGGQPVVIMSSLGPWY